MSARALIFPLQQGCVQDRNGWPTGYVLDIKLYWTDRSASRYMSAWEFIYLNYCSFFRQRKSNEQKNVKYLSLRSVNSIKCLKSWPNSSLMNCKIRTKVVSAMQNFVRACTVWELCGYELNNNNDLFITIRTDCN